MPRNLLLRSVASVLLVAVGIPAVVYGVKYHGVQVFEAKQVTEVIKIPIPFPPGGPIGGSSPWGGGPTDASPSADGSMSESGPAFINQTVTTTRQVPKIEFEPQLLREMTVGGVALVRTDEEVPGLARGSLRQTYSGQAPSLCPT